MNSSYLIDIVLVAASAVFSFFFARGGRAGSNIIAKSVAVALPLALVVYSQWLWASTGYGVIDRATCFVLRDAKTCARGDTPSPDLETASAASETRPVTPEQEQKEPSASPTAVRLEWRDPTAKPAAPMRRVSYKAEPPADGPYGEWIVQGTIDGLTYEVAKIKAVNIEVLYTEDLNQDGTLDAVFSQFEGGNCCPSNYGVALDLGDGHFTMQYVEDVYSWSGPELEWKEGRWFLRFVSLNEGMNTNDYEETVSLHTIEHNKLFLASASTNAQVKALAELRSSAYDVSSPETYTLRLDINTDGKADLLTCGLWERWGRLSGCKVALNGQLGDVEIGSSCKRLGVLGVQNDGMASLVCDADLVLQYDRAKNAYPAPEASDP
jgi:hypothetical protein